MDLFVRIDDYADATPEMCRVVEWLLGTDCPVHIAAIPGLLTRAGAQFLEYVIDKSPGNVEVGQHGYMHTCRQHGRKRFEVGPGMSCREQSEIIARGQRELHRRLEVPTVAVFTPPFNGYDDNTIPALIENGFEILSAAVCAPRNKWPLLKEISVNIDVCERYLPTAVLRRIEDLAKDLRDTCRRDRYLGILLHPTLTFLDDQWLRSLFNALGAIGKLNFVLLSQANVFGRVNEGGMVH
jgi:hypothetical protein